MGVGGSNQIGIPDLPLALDGGWHVGRLTDLGPILFQTGEKILAGYWQGIGAAYGQEFASESIPMVIYYC